MRIFANTYNLRSAQELSFITQFQNKLRSVSLGVRGILFISLFLIASIPILTFAIWVERSAVQKEIAAVTEKHLVVAKNMSAAISRYVTDVKIVVSLLEKLTTHEIEDEPISDRLDTIHIRYVATINSNDKIQSHILSKSLKRATLPDVALMNKLRKIAVAAKGEFAISGIQKFMGIPHFFIVRDLGQGRLLLAPVAPIYLDEIQKSIAFGHL